MGSSVARVRRRTTTAEERNKYTQTKTRAMQYAFTYIEEKIFAVLGKPEQHKQNCENNRKSGYTYTEEKRKNKDESAKTEKQYKHNKSRNNYKKKTSAIAFT